MVAEIGLNHDGNFDLAEEMIRQARLAGADIAKFQFGWRSDPGDLNPIDERRALRLREQCDYYGIEMMASIIDEPALELTRIAGLSRLKIASRTVVDDPDLCRKILDEGKETFVSLGMWNGEGYPFGRPDEQRLRYIHCISKYPASPSDIGEMPSEFGVDGIYGYSDHHLGLAACMLAIGRGARYVEKHFTLNKASQVIRDHVLSATPDEFRVLSDVGKSLAGLVRGEETGDSREGP